VFSTIFSGTNDLIVVVVAVVVLFGGTQLPKLARNAGTALKEFRSGHGDATDPQSPAAAAGPAPAASPPVAAPAPAPVVVVTPTPALTPGQVTAAAAAAPADDRITLTRAQLDALLAEKASAPKAPDNAGSETSN
jgi:sec-independent protein translocase protein TatA